MSQDGRPFNNCGLFSNHYLENQVRESPEWNEPAELGEVRSAINELYQRKARVLENYNELQLEENFIRPVLRILGHHFGVQGTVHGKGKRPDYAFFPDEDSLNEAEARLEEDYYQRAVAIGDAKAWKVSLDKQRGRGSLEMQNPSFQIDAYLRDTPPKWAILTSGRLWRLYHESTSYKLDSFYEVDLPALLVDGDPEAFKYFYLFFRREAFPKVVDGESFLDRVRERSIAFAQEISEDLQKNVYKAMKILAEGFIIEARNGLDGSSVGPVQENALRLLYRLLFIFYAESRGLLDADNKYYYELSLQKLKSEVAGKLDRREPLLSVSYSYWEKLKNLFNLINDGSESRRIPKEDFYIPAYNGGLFDPEKNEFLEEMRIGDIYLAEAIDLLARSGNVGSRNNGRENNDGREKGFVDYSSLEIRHLGSIYEGLLEYRLMVAEEETAAVKEKGKELWLPSSEVGNRKVLEETAAGEIYLATDRGERKATGSYYTPDYIVKYIVKNTLEPIIRQKLDDWGGVGRLPDYILSIKVLDPAMGSGHFLVEATDQLARFLVQAWGTSRPEETDTREVAERDVHWARREVVRNCIYGVDLNPMAVELAKLILWLTTVASNKPLSFLDHHLRCGNSLIGAKLSDLMILPNSGREPSQMPMWQFVLKQQKENTEDLLKRYAEMATRPDDDLATVKWKKEKFEELKRSEISRRINELANVWLSTYFGNKVEETDYEELQNHLSPNRFPDWQAFREQEWFRRAQELASEKRFFHWELEFPEAFSEKDNSGFEMVIGNPPYDELSEVALKRKIDEKNYLQSNGLYREAATFRINLYRLFIACAIEKIKTNGSHSFIVPLSLLGDRFTFELRRKLLNEYKIQFIEAFPQKDDPNDRVFFDAKLPTCVYVLNRQNPYGEFWVRTHPGKDILKSSPSYETSSQELAQFDPVNFTIPLLDESAWSLARRLATSKNLCPIGEIASPMSGEVVFNEAFRSYLSEDSQKTLVLRGGHIQRYYLLDDPKQGTPVYIDKERWLRDSEEGSSAFAHLKPRIVYQESAALDNWRRIIATYLPAGNICGHKICYFVDIKYDMLAFLAIYNSTIIEWRFGLVSTTNNLSAYQIIAIPFPRIHFTTPEPERARLAAELKTLYQAGKFGEILSSVEGCLPKDAQGNFISEQEKSDVVHDLLAILAEQMLEMNKQKQQEIKGFLGWLEREIGAKVEDLTPRTKIQSYYDYSYEDLLAVLKKNKETRHQSL